MAYGNFKPIIWSKYIEHELKKFTVFKEDCDYRFEGEAGKGKTVKILGVGKPTIGDYTGASIGAPETVADSSVTLLIDQAKFFNFQVDDVDAAQAQEGLMPALMEEATRALAYEEDKFIGQQLAKNAGQKIKSRAIATEAEAVACLKYIKTKFCRAMLGTLKVTQDNPKPTWANVPLQDFTANSDIDWSQSIGDIDKQLYAKYALSAEEMEFIEKMIKPME